MTLEFLIRPAREADLDALTELWAASARSSHSFMPTSDFEEHHAMMRDYILPSTDLLIASDAAGNDLGFIGMRDDRVELLYIATTAQAQGVGTFLLNRAIAEHGATSVQVYADNEVGMGFYRSHGFTEVRRHSHDAGGRPYPIALLERKVRKP